MDRCQSVRLIKTHLIICDMTYLGQSVTLTLDDLGSKLPSDFLSKKVGILIDPP